IAADVHDGGAVVEGAELVEGGERGPGVGGLVADGAVELGGVPDGLVNGEPEVRRADHQVVRPRLHRRRRPDRSGTPNPGPRAAPACAWSRSRCPRVPGPPAAPAAVPGAGWPAS